MSLPKLSNPHYIIRPATKADVPGMTECFFRSFNAKFWQHFIPDNEHMRAWWDRSWEMGIDNPRDANFVAVDTQHGDKVIGFSRWMKPQEDGYQNHDASWAEIVPEHWDMGVANPFFEGMDHNRLVLLEKRPHWFLDMLGVHEDYQGQGIAGALIKWGTDQADEAGIETHLHASEVGRPYYLKWHNFENQMLITIPDRPAYGSYEYWSLTRKPQKTPES